MIRGRHYSENRRQKHYDSPDMYRFFFTYAGHKVSDKSRTTIVDTEFITASFDAIIDASRDATNSPRRPTGKKLLSSHTNVCLIPAPIR